jgi:uncharacterized protein (DUF1800 family)
MLKRLPASEWNAAKAAHLLNRAGFGGPPSEIEQLARLDFEDAVSRLVDFDKIPDPTPAPDWARPEPDRMEQMRELRSLSAEERQMKVREQQRLQRERLMELRGWWLRRMAGGPRPLQEKLVLFWHGHFATSAEKVREAYLMWRQNELFRRMAAGNWPDLLVAVGKDPAMLLYLDQAQSRRGNPNENYAREVMELFALGEGHYTEKDVTEAARALTGWSYDRVGQKFEYRARAHDDGLKTVLGRTDNFDGETVSRLIAQQPQSALFLSGKLWNYFAGQPPSPELNAALAEAFRGAGLNVKLLLRTMFRSEAFYAPGVIRAQVKSPVQWLVGGCRVLERELPPPMVSANLLRNLGQELFAPPNVKGWDGGLAWITTNNLLARYNQSALLISGDASGMALPEMRNNQAARRAVEQRLKHVRLGGVELDRILTPEAQRDKAALVASLQQRLLQGQLSPKQQQALRDYLDAHGELDPPDIYATIRFIMCTPDFQLT